jgi:hypothetical protein
MLSRQPNRWFVRASALALVAVISGGSLVSGDEPYRIHRMRLADICTDGLPWTGHRPLTFPARWPRDEQGVPMVIVGGRRYYRPGALAINGMKRIDAYRDGGDARQLRQALKQAQRLRIMSLTRRRASWLPFWYDYAPAGQRAPWFNAMVQGLALSFYIRLHDVTGDPVHLRAAHRTFRSFLRLGQWTRPWVAYVDGRGSLWLEHYPLRRPDHILNAHLHAVFGIYEYWQLTRSTEARRVLKGAITTMKRYASLCRRPGGLSLYGLRSRTRHVKYHEIHIWQLRLLGRISSDEEFLRMASALARDSRPTGEVPGRPARQGPRIAGPQCRPGSLG